MARDSKTTTYKPRTPRKRMTDEEKADWNDLYAYVKNILNYDKNQALPSDMVLRLKGMLNNKYIANNLIENTANYSYKTILNTFKFCTLDIQNGLRKNTFNNETHKLNYIMKIVERNLNDVYMREKKAEKAKEQTENIDISIFAYNGAEYKPKEKADTKEKIEDKFLDLW